MCASKGGHTRGGDAALTLTLTLTLTLSHPHPHPNPDYQVATLLFDHGASVGSGGPAVMAMLVTLDENQLGGMAAAQVRSYRNPTLASTP